MNNKGSGLTPAQALDKLDALYEQSVVALRHWQIYYKWRIT